MSNWRTGLLAASALLLAAGCQGRPVAAAWSPLVALGNVPLLSDPSCASGGGYVAVCAAIGPNHEVYTNVYSNGAWAGWAIRGGIAATPPSCAGASFTWASTQTTVFCVTAHPAIGSLVAEIIGSVGFQSEITLSTGDVLATPPSCVTLNSAIGQVFCAEAPAGEGETGDAIVGATFSRASSTGYISTTVPLTDVGDVSIGGYSPLGCAPDGLGESICAALGQKSAVLASAYFSTATGQGNGVPWVLGANLGGFATQPPQCIYAGVPGKVACFTTDKNSALYVNEYTAKNTSSFASTDWTGWKGMRGLVGGFGCAAIPATSVPNYVCGAVSPGDNGFYTNQGTATKWQGWAPLATGFTGNPSCFLLQVSASQLGVMCVVRGLNQIAQSTFGP